MADLRYPLGEFSFTGPEDAPSIARAVDQIKVLPVQLRSSIEGLENGQLDTPYRPGGWTVAQVVHHLSDSHLNGYLRTKWCLTEDRPTIRTYFEERWADLPDAASLDVGMSLDLLQSLHQRWVYLLRRLDSQQLERMILHPDWGEVTLGSLVTQYAWHGCHHVAHITSLRQREGW